MLQLVLVYHPEIINELHLELSTENFMGSLLSKIHAEASLCSAVGLK